MLNQPNGLIIFIVIIVIFFIIWIIVANNRTSETHIHPQPFYNHKINTIKYRLSPHGVKYTVSEDIFADNTDVVSKGPTETKVHVVFINDGGVSKTHQLPDGTIGQNLILSITNAQDRVEIHPLACTGRGVFEPGCFSDIDTECIEDCEDYGGRDCADACSGKR